MIIMLDAACNEYSAREPDVCIIGMGYVGLTLALTLADVGHRVLGYEINSEWCGLLRRGQPRFQERDVPEILRYHLGRSLTVTDRLPTLLPEFVVICVGTPLDPATQTPDLGYLEQAVRDVAPRVRENGLVIIRSTVPIGTCRNKVLPILKAHQTSDVLLAFCPERTIQGRALEELRTLPQIVGGLNETAVRKASLFFESIAPQAISVSSIETAEAVKLACNAHTDLIYGFGNEIGLVAETLELDAYEIINTANLNYPRPDISKPGFVGGSCLTKDPYFLIHSLSGREYTPSMTRAARSLNESLPARVGYCVARVLKSLKRHRLNIQVLVSGFAYKGTPETDDLRGAVFEEILGFVRPYTHQIKGHDFVVSDQKLSELGVEPVEHLRAGFENADVVVILNNHSLYSQHNFEELVASMRRPAFIYDAWGVFFDQFNHNDVAYTTLGRGMKNIGRFLCANEFSSPEAPVSSG